ncbi:hypothetical protein Dimus_004329 [Dionaea muscipula]
MGEVLVIDVEPGWKKATRITFPGKGHHEPGSLPGDIVFVIGEKAHAVSRRNGNDPIVHQWNSFFEARTGKTLVLTTLKQVDAIQACGGQKTADGNRFRTGGGVLWSILKAREPNAYKEIMKRGREFEAFVLD